MWFSRLRTQLVSMRVQIQSLASLSGLRIHCCELWRCCGCGVGWQLQLWFDPYAAGTALKSKKKKKRGGREREKKSISLCPFLPLNISYLFVSIERFGELNYPVLLTSNRAMRSQPIRYFLFVFPCSLLPYYTSSNPESL